MKESFRSKASTEEFIRELKLIAHHIQEVQGEALKKIEDPVLLIVELPNSQKAYFHISKEGIFHRDNQTETADRIVVSYRDLQRLIEKPSRIVRYVFEGKVKILGNYRRVLSTIQKLF